MSQDIKDIFQLPISFNKKKKELNSTLIQDLELIKTINEDLNENEKNDSKDNEKNNSKDKITLYKHIFAPDNCFGEIMLDSFAKYYTTDTKFLKDTQTMLKNYVKTEEMDSYKFQELYDTWNEIKNETGFCEKYLFIDWEYGKFLNHNPTFLQIMSLYNIISPIFAGVILSFFTFFTTLQ
jgi:hypothetical protein